MHHSIDDGGSPIGALLVNTRTPIGQRLPYVPVLRGISESRIPVLRGDFTRG